MVPYAPRCLFLFANRSLDTSYQYRKRWGSSAQPSRSCRKRILDFSKRRKKILDYPLRIGGVRFFGQSGTDFGYGHCDWASLGHRWNSRLGVSREKSLLDQWLRLNIWKNDWVSGTRPTTEKPLACDTRSSTKQCYLRAFLHNLIKPYSSFFPFSLCLFLFICRFLPRLRRHVTTGKHCSAPRKNFTRA